MIEKPRHFQLGEINVPSKLVKSPTDGEPEDSISQQGRRVGTPRESEVPILDQVKPFFLRGGTVGEISAITGLKPKQIHNAIGRRVKSSKVRRVDESLFSPENIKQRESRAHINKRKRIADRPPMSETERNNIEFARRLHGNSLITEDLQHWDQLNEFYNRHGRPLPESFYDKLRLEIFISARRQAENGDRTLVEMYITQGNEIDKNWFMNSLREEQRFITEKLSTNSNRIGSARDGSTRSFSRALDFFERAGVEWSEDS